MGFDAAAILKPDAKPYEEILRSKGDFSEADINELRAFIARTGELGKYIDGQMASYVSGSPATRGVRAEFDVARLTRWTSDDVKGAQSVLKHSRSLARFIEAYPDDRLPEDRRHLVALAQVHDKAEALIGDMTPAQKKRYEISGDFKKKLEAMAICILYESAGLSHERTLIEEYEAHETDASKIVSDFDKCYAVMEAYQFYDKKPEIYQRALDDLIENNRIKSPVGLDLLDTLKDTNSADFCAALEQFEVSVKTPEVAHAL